MPRFDHFNILGPIYDYIFGRSADHQMVRIAAVEKGHRLLDVGGGTGRVAVQFQALAGEVLVADAALGMLREAKKKGLRIVHSHSENLPLPAKSFDRVILVDALHHVKDQVKTLEEIWRVLAPGGWMVIEEPDIRNFVVKLVALGEKIALMRSRFVSPERICELCLFEGVESQQIIKEKGIAWVIITKAI